MPSDWFSSPRYAELKFRRDQLFYSPGNFVFNQREIARLDEQMERERHLHEAAGRPFYLIYRTGSPVPGEGRFESEADAWAHVQRVLDAGRIGRAFAGSLAVVHVDPEGVIRGASWESPDGQRQAREAEMGRV